MWQKVKTLIEEVPMKKMSRGCVTEMELSQKWLEFKFKKIIFIILLLNVKMCILMGVSSDMERFICTFENF